MDLNETKRKRSIPEWMKCPDSSPIKSPNKTKSRGLKPQRPSYPTISIKKSKQIPKPVKDAVPHTSKPHQPKISGPPLGQKIESGECSSSSFAVDFQAESYSVSEDDYLMTVDELTGVAQELINEARQEKRLL